MIYEDTVSNQQGEIVSAVRYDTVAKTVTTIAAGQAPATRPMTAPESSYFSEKEKEDTRQVSVAEMIAKAIAYRTGATSRQTTIAADRTNATLTAFAGLAALAGNATAAQVRDRTIQQDLAIKALIQIVSRELAAEDGILSFVKDQIYLDGEFLEGLRDLSA